MNDTNRSAASQHDPSSFEEKTRRAAPQLQEDFGRAHAHDDPAPVAGDTEDAGSKQVRETAMKPRPVPPPSLDHAGARQAHNDAMYRDVQATKARNQQTKDEQRAASKEAFLKAAAEKKKAPEPDHGMERS